MSTIKNVVAAGAALLMSIGALAQTAPTTDEARAAAAQRTAAYVQAHAFDRPALEDANVSDSQAAGRNEARIAAYHSFHRALSDYEAGVRSTPIAVDSSTDSARAESARVVLEHTLAAHVAVMQSNPAARLAHQAALSETVAAK